MLAVDAVLTEEEVLEKSLKEMLVLEVSLRITEEGPSWVLLLWKDWWC